MALSAFATAEDVAARWPGYEEGAEGRVEALIGDVSAMISKLLADHGVAVDEGDEVQAANLRAVTCHVVIRALGAADVADGAPVSQWTQTATPYSTSYTFSNPNGDAYLTRQERRLLGLTGGRACVCAPGVTPDA